MIVAYPHWLRRAITLTAVVHDLAVMAAGAFAWREQPLTILMSLNSGFRLIWATMLFFGGLISLYGIVRKSFRFETTGCVLTSCAKLVWFVAALRPQTDVLGSSTLAAILLAGTSGTMWRVWGLYVGQYLRARE
jgi:hypothetical protein